MRDSLTNRRLGQVPRKHSKTVKRDLKVSRLRFIDNKQKIRDFDQGIEDIQNLTERRKNDSLSFDKLKRQNNENISVMKAFVDHTQKKLSFLRKSKAQQLTEESTVFQSKFPNIFLKIIQIILEGKFWKSKIYPPNISTLYSRTKQTFNSQT